MHIVKNELMTKANAPYSIEIEPELFMVKSHAFIEISECISNDFNVNLVTSQPPPLVLNKKPHEFKRNSVVFIKPGTQIHSRQNLPSKDYFLLTIPPAKFEAILTNMGVKNANILSFPYSRTLFQLAGGLFYEMEHKAPGHALIMQSKLTEFQVQLIRESRLLETNKTSAGRNYQYVEKVKDYIHSYYNANISLDDLCSELNLSRFHLIRIFKEHTGTTPHAYLMDTRLEKALILVAKGTFSVEEVSSLCGFLSRTHFSHSFKLKYGCSPAQYNRA